MKTGAAFALLGAISSVAAHATFQEFWVNSVDEDQKCIRLPVSSPGQASLQYLSTLISPQTSNSPVTNVMGKDMVCNVGGTKGVAGVCEVEGRNPVSISIRDTSLTEPQPDKERQSRCTSSRTTEPARLNR